MGSGHQIDDFPLGEHDTPDRLLIAEKLYGRQREADTLLAAFDRIVNGGAPELVLVSGYSGIGKSSIVNELQPVLVPPRGLFASGKFDQYKRDIPYSTLSQAFQQLIRPLLGKREADLAPWRDALRDALGPNARLIVDLVPELEIIIGETPPVPELPPQDAQRRFQMVFRQFIAVFARPEHPLALFLDDLQWLDAATLDLLQDLMWRSDGRHLLLIGAYRDNEVTAAHPLMRTLEAMRPTGRMQDIKLGPLTAEDLGALLADSLRCDAEEAAPLAALVHAKTGGNPFFVMQFLHVLAGEGLLTFHHERARWSWDLAGIHAKRYTDNVVELLAGKITRLPPDTQDALRQFACLGNVADATMLSLVLGTPEQQVHTTLWEALRQQLIERVDERSYKFVHDRVQEAAYALIPQASRAAAHLTIGRLLVAHTSAEARDDAIFEIVNQLNRGASLITSPDEREQLAELNLTAGKRAMASSAYVSALAYLTAGAAMLPEDAWERRQELAFALELHAADCEVSTAAMPAAEARLTALAGRAVGAVQRCLAAQRRVDLYSMLGAGAAAVPVALECLRHVGIEWSAHPTDEEARSEYERIRSRLGDRTIEDLVDLPLMQDPEAQATLGVLTSLVLPTLYTDRNLYALSVCKAINLSLEHGTSEAAPLSYATMGLIAGPRFGDYDAGYQFAKLAGDLLERRGLTHFGHRTYTGVAVVVPWTRPLREGIDPSRRAFQMAKAHGDPTFAALAARGLSSILLAAGDPLDQVEREVEDALAFVRPYGFFLDRLSAPLALARTLRGQTVTLGSLDDGAFTERGFEERATGQPSRAFLECFYWLRKLQARFFAGEYASAIEAADKVEAWYASSPALSLFPVEKADSHFYAALTRASRCEPIGPDPYDRHRDALGQHVQQLRAFAANCPQNFEDRADLVGAEIARIEGRPLEAMDLYERAILSARASGFVHDEALACELAGRFYAARGLAEIAQHYLRKARQGYLRWGADGKVMQLDQQHAHLTHDQPVTRAMGVIATPLERLDLATVIKVSQAVSGEMVPDKLIDKLTRAAIEYAGAERGVLIAPHRKEELREELQIDAEATTRGAEVIVQLGHDTQTAAALPQSLVRYAMRTRETVILDDAASPHPFSADPDIGRRRPRSILCVPLINQGKLIGLLYLENSLAPRVFAPDRVTVLKVLASQAAISLENTRLYRDLSEREARIRALKDQLYNENLVLRDEVDRTSMFEEIVGGSEPLKTVLSRLARVAPTESTVLITGETGTGKELVARAIHRRSPRSARPFVSVNCAAVPRELIASELFGHEKGAFTGAIQRRLGRFELANGGTIFLDEVGELPMETQVSLLRVLQEREFDRVGGSVTVRVDVRLIAATNRDLPATIETGAFRSDLFYRLNVFPIAMPALRERAGDIPILVEYFIDRYARKAGKTIRRVNRRTLDRLQSYPWPGNVRELQNVIERSVIVSDTDEFTVDKSWLSGRPTIAGALALTGSLAAHERAMIEEALRASDGRVFGPSGAAARLGIPRSTLESKIRALRINKSHFRART
jgi:predicted ATPase/transcriptional regulator with GAF, ATPase, and Fis domain